jgi:hypothetical protein
MLISLFLLVVNAILIIIRTITNTGGPIVWTWNSNIVDTMNAIITPTLQFEGIIPIHLLFHIIFLIFSFELSLWLVRFCLSIYNWARGTGGIEI